MTFLHFQGIISIFISRAYKLILKRRYCFSPNSMNLINFIILCIPICILLYFTFNVDISISHVDLQGTCFEPIFCILPNSILSATNLLHSTGRNNSIYLFAATYCSYLLQLLIAATYCSYLLQGALSAPNIPAFSSFPFKISINISPKGQQQLNSQLK